jgi:ATP-dependent RNA helicase DOB1
VLDLSGKNLTQRNELDAIGKAMDELWNQFDGQGVDMPLIDPVLDMGIASASFLANRERLTEIDARIKAHPLFKHKKQSSKNDKASDKALRRAENIASLIDTESSLTTKINATELSKFRHELTSRAEVLRKLDHVDDDFVLKSKGRAACWIDTADELLVTELMFNGVFRKLDHHQLCALCSMFIPVEKSKENEDIHERAIRYVLRVSQIPPLFAGCPRVIT